MKSLRTPGNFPHIILFRTEWAIPAVQIFLPTQYVCNRRKDLLAIVTRLIIIVWDHEIIETLAEWELATPRLRPLTRHLSCSARTTIPTSFVIAEKNSFAIRKHFRALYVLHITSMGKKCVRKLRTLFCDPTRLLCRQVICPKDAVT